MTTGDRVAHFAEVDVPAADTPDHQALYLRPVQRLTGGHRYAVALLTTLKARDGSDLPVPPGMQALLDGTTTSHPLLEAMRARFPDVLAALAAAGVGKDQILVAWDFTVASDELVRRDATTARDRAVAALDTNAQTFTINTDAPIDDGSVIARRDRRHLRRPAVPDQRRQVPARHGPGPRRRRPARLPARCTGPRSPRSSRPAPTPRASRSA